MCLIKGDFTFFSWENGDYGKYEAKKQELESLGYKFKKREDDDLNYYEIYENVEGDSKTITVCCM